MLLVMLGCCWWFWDVVGGVGGVGVLLVVLGWCWWCWGGVGGVRVVLVVLG